jgi:tRNA modification GTPase
MSLHLDDTIAAIASAPGGALRGILRISGPGVISCLEEVFEAADGTATTAVCRPTVIAGRLKLDEVHRLDTDLYLWPTGRSYTGQPVAELHTIGSPPLLEAVLRIVCAAGARLAGPGEFTMRSFLNGKLDLTQAEAVLGVIDAQDRRQLTVALEQLGGGLASPLQSLRSDLLDLLSHLEAGLDFVEEDIEFIAADELTAQLDRAVDRMDVVAERIQTRSPSAVEPLVVVTGYPNVGKSSLVNALIGQEAALVSEFPGTTRDFILRTIDADGLACRIVDTAGIDLTEDDPLDAASRAMAGAQLERADIQLLCLDSSRPLNEWERRQLGESHAAVRILVLTKSDLPRMIDCSAACVPTSSHMGTGMDELRTEIRDRIESSVAGEGGVVGNTAVRCGESVRLAVAHLRTARGLAAVGGGDELVAAELRGALDQLGMVVGAVHSDDILDRVFSRFCIGK